MLVLAQFVSARPSQQVGLHRAKGCDRVTLLVGQCLVPHDVLDRVTQLIKGVRAQRALPVRRRMQNHANRQCNNVVNRVLEIIHARDLGATIARSLREIASDLARLRHSAV